MCVHPAFRFYLNDIATALKPVAVEIAGLPGAPASATEVASTSGGQEVMSGISGNPPVFKFTAEHVGWSWFGEFNGIPDAAAWRTGFQQGLVGAFVREPLENAGLAPLGAAQQAVENALLTAVGTQPPGGEMIVNGQSVAGTPADVSAVAQRFMALSAGARHAWLVTHLAALRAGKITLAQIP